MRTVQSPLRQTKRNEKKTKHKSKIGRRKRSQTIGIHSKLKINSLCERDSEKNKKQNRNISKRRKPKKKQDLQQRQN